MDQLELIQSKIYEVRGQRVMLDFDLAELYQVETRVLNQAVKRNSDRFPPDFMFRLTKEECLRSQIVILKTEQGKHLKYMPNAFTEMGVAMLSSVLRSSMAIQVNINIMRAFTAARQFLANPNTGKGSMLQREVRELKEYIEEMFADQNDINEDTRMQLELINQTLAELQVQKKLSDKPRRTIGFIRPEED